MAVTTWDSKQETLLKLRHTTLLYVKTKKIINNNFVLNAEVLKQFEFTYVIITFVHKVIQ